jgi:hypothetical protein
LDLDYTSDSLDEDFGWIRWSNLRINLTERERKKPLTCFTYFF